MPALLQPLLYRFFDAVDNPIGNRKLAQQDRYLAGFDLYRLSNIDGHDAVLIISASSLASAN